MNYTCLGQLFPDLQELLLEALHLRVELLGGCSTFLLQCIEACCQLRLVMQLALQLRSERQVALLVMFKGQLHGRIRQPVKDVGGN